MLKYLKLIRLPNLLMIPLTMYLLRWGVIQTALEYGYSQELGQQIQFALSDSIFLIIVLINCFLGAAGYVINDYFDRRIDGINRPELVLIGNSIPRRTAILMHWVFNGIAFLLVAFVSYHFHNIVILLVFAMIAGLFWLYSTTYKKQFLIGNIIVALGTAIVPLQVAYFDLVPLNEMYGVELAGRGLSFISLLGWLGAFSLFAFLINLIREIIKDVEDFEGDRSYGCNTIPVILGVKASKVIISVFSVGVALLLYFFFYKFLGDTVSLYYLLIMVMIPLIINAVLIFRANSIKYYHRLSWLMKIIMLTGIFYALVAKYIMIFNFVV